MKPLVSFRVTKIPQSFLRIIPISTLSSLHMILHRAEKKHKTNKQKNNRAPCLWKVLKELMLNQWRSETWPLISRMNVCKPSCTFNTKPEQKINYILRCLLLNLLVGMTQLLDMQCIVNDVL